MNAKRTSVNIPEKVFEALQQRADEDGQTTSEAMRRAFWLYLYVRTRQDEGAEILVEPAEKDRLERLVLMD